MTDEIRLTRTIAASADEVFDAWTDADSVAQWLVPIPGGSTSARTDARVGGTFQFDMAGNGEVMSHHGEYLRVERPRLLEFTWFSHATGGARSVVTVELRAIDAEATELTLTHRLLPTPSSADAHRGGWGRGLDRLVALFATTTTD
jgi:uncharacterized protein YndB with AHSA1/START domain